MEEQLRILGFKNYVNRNGAPLVVLLVSEDRKITHAFPDGTQECLGEVPEVDITMFGFIPGNGYPENLDQWKKGQIAYLDLGGKVHVGQKEEILPLVSVDLLQVRDKTHQRILREILEEETPAQ